MAPSRDRLLHFGFKATVSDRGRELGGQKIVGASSGRRGSDQIRAGDPRLKAQVPRGPVRARESSQCWRGSGDVRPCSALLARPRARAHSRPPHSTPCTVHTHTHTYASARALGHFPASPCPGGLAPRHPTFGSLAGSRSGDAPGGGGVGSRHRRGALLPSPGVPRPGRLCPMRSGVAGRLGVFLFWVEVEALERTELATGSRRGRGRRGRWWRPPRHSSSLSSESGGRAEPCRHRLPLPELRGLPWPLSLHSTRRSALPGPHPLAP